jgi:hypothetical protein
VFPVEPIDNISDCFAYPIRNTSRKKSEKSKSQSEDLKHDPIQVMSTFCKRFLQQARSFEIGSVFGR